MKSDCVSTDGDFSSGEMEVSGMGDRAIGIMGGTFDPIHIGHLITAACAADQLNLEQVIFVPAAIPPHKRHRMLTSEAERLAMTRLAVQDHPHFSVSDLEIQRGGISYTVETLRWFREAYPEHRLYFIIGGDTVPDIVSWKSPEELMKLAYFVVGGRPGYTYEGMNQTFYQRYIERIVFLEMPGVGISSTEIRQRVRKGKTIQYQLPPAVEAFIHEHHLYRESHPIGDEG